MYRIAAPSGARRDIVAFDVGAGRGARMFKHAVHRLGRIMVASGFVSMAMLTTTASAALAYDCSIDDCRADATWDPNGGTASFTGVQAKMRINCLQVASYSSTFLEDFLYISGAQGDYFGNILVGGYSGTLGGHTENQQTFWEELHPAVNEFPAVHLFPEAVDLNQYYDLKIEKDGVTSGLWHITMTNLTTGVNHPAATTNHLQSGGNLIQGSIRSTASAGHTFASFSALKWRSMQGILVNNWYSVNGGGTVPYRSVASNMFISTVTANQWYQMGQASTC
jgi:hypothetical protein